MFRMLGRLMWVAVGAVGLKAWEESQRQNQKQSGQPQRAPRRGKRAGGSTTNAD